MSASYDSNLDEFVLGTRLAKTLLSKIGTELKSILMYKTLYDMTPDYLRTRFVYRDKCLSFTN